jgi:hypothetical protein
LFSRELDHLVVVMQSAGFGFVVAALLTLFVVIFDVFAGQFCGRFVWHGVSLSWRVSAGHPLVDCHQFLVGILEFCLRFSELSLELFLLGLGISVSVDVSCIQHFFNHFLCVFQSIYPRLHREVSSSVAHGVVWWVLGWVGIAVGVEPDALLLCCLVEWAHLVAKCGQLVLNVGWLLLLELVQSFFHF